jgi:hypothetical protein
VGLSRLPISHTDSATTADGCARRPTVICAHRRHFVSVRLVNLLITGLSVSGALTRRAKAADDAPPTIAAICTGRLFGGAFVTHSTTEPHICAEFETGSSLLCLSLAAHRPTTDASVG